LESADADAARAEDQVITDAAADDHGAQGCVRGD
jgi:hypothetical protein